jgi:enoyl-CoA hydratase/carnithine racemase/methionyl-tRNA formyltransferase
MKILFLCTAHNSLSQRLHSVLALRHYVTVEYALSDELMIEATEMVNPDLIICPFLTTRVPAEVYRKFLTLIVHPGPPGDVGPSSLDWLLMGDDGVESDSDKLIQQHTLGDQGRSHWGVTVLQAIEEFDKGPVWAFDQFPVNIDDCQVTKSTLYRGPVTRAVLAATQKAIERIENAATTSSLHSGAPLSPPPSANEENKATNSHWKIHPDLKASDSFREQSVTSGEAFKGGQTHHRPLLRAAQRDFDPKTHTAAEISRRIRSADSQPGCLSSIFGPKLYLYGGMVDDGKLPPTATAGSIVACRDDAVCIATCDNKGIWITHVRRVKSKTDPALWPKVPAVQALLELYEKTMEPASVQRILNLRQRQPTISDTWSRAPWSTFQEIWIDYDTTTNNRKVAYLYFNFYNGAMSTTQCKRLLNALQHLLSNTQETPLAAVVLMGGSYFSNGIHLNVIDSAKDPAQESWLNINAIDDLVQCLLHDFPAHDIATIAAVRGNCAAGGVALATACDVVLAGENVIFNPAYRAMGLYGSEFHTLTYSARCSTDGARRILRSMLPVSARAANDIGLVDQVLTSWESVLDAEIRSCVNDKLASAPGKLGTSLIPQWKLSFDSKTLSVARATELAEMAKDFWSPRSERYHSRRNDFVRKVKPEATPRRFALHRNVDDGVDEEDEDRFDSVDWFILRKTLTQHSAASEAEQQTDTSSLPSKAEKEADRRQLADLSNHDEKKTQRNEDADEDSVKRCSVAITMQSSLVSLLVMTLCTSLYLMTICNIRLIPFLSLQIT